jgi:hypothetical protein
MIVGFSLSWRPSPLISVLAALAYHGFLAMTRHLQAIIGGYCRGSRPPLVASTKALTPGFGFQPM